MLSLDVEEGMRGMYSRCKFDFRLSVRFCLMNNALNTIVHHAPFIRIRIPSLHSTSFLVQSPIPFVTNPALLQQNPDRRENACYMN